MTYVKAFDEMRALFAAVPLARERRYTASTFSFNMAGGRCEACEGAGHVQVDMVFLANVFVPCETCGGTRFKREVLDVKLHGRSIHDVLDWTVDEALHRLHQQPRLARALWHLQQVGLGYLRLGQPATTLSGGEAQRLKIAPRAALRAAGSSAAASSTSSTSRPRACTWTTCARCAACSIGWSTPGHTVLVIEHHLDVIKRADWVIDLGPGRGRAVAIVGRAPPKKSRACRTLTGRYLQDLT